MQSTCIGADPAYAWHVTWQHTALQSHSAAKLRTLGEHRLMVHRAGLRRPCRGQGLLNTAWCAGGELPEVPGPDVQHSRHDRGFHLHHLDGPCAAHGPHLHDSGEELSRACSQSLPLTASATTSLPAVATVRHEGTPRTGPRHMVQSCAATDDYGSVERCARTRTDRWMH